MPSAPAWLADAGRSAAAGSDTLAVVETKTPDAQPVPLLELRGEETFVEAFPQLREGARVCLVEDRSMLGTVLGIDYSGALVEWDDPEGKYADDPRAQRSVISISNAASEDCHYELLHPEDLLVFESLA